MRSKFDHRYLNIKCNPQSCETLKGKQAQTQMYKLALQGWQVPAPNVRLALQVQNPNLKHVLQNDLYSTLGVKLNVRILLQCRTSDCNCRQKLELNILITPSLHPSLLKD